MNLPDRGAEPRILLIDGDLQAREVTAAHLRSEGMELAQINPAQGLPALATIGQFDLILLNPEPSDGKELSFLEKIRLHPQTSHLPVMIFTASSDEDLVISAFETGATDVIPKPFRSGELTARIRAHLRHRRLLLLLEDTNRKLEAARSAAEESARVKSQFLANMSHEIRTPMNAVIGITELLGETALNNSQRELVDTIRNSGHQLLAIINDVLDFSKIESSRMELEHRPFDLRKCIEGALDLLAAKAGEKHLELLSEIGDGTPTLVCGDVVRLGQVLTNLISNGIKFTSSGEVIVTAGIDPGSPNKGKVPVHFQVRDTGIGIHPDKFEKLFQSFCQADASVTREFGGTGLGLAISKRLVELMEGRMWLESEPGKGTTFHFTVPLEAAPGGAVEERSAALQKTRLLVVEDHEATRQVLITAARRWGMEVASAASADEAMHWFHQGGRADFALIDLSLPPIDGRHLGREICNLLGTATPHLVLLSHLDAVSQKTETNSEPFAACLFKPVKTAQIMQTLVQLKTGSPPPGAQSSVPAKKAGNLANKLPMKILLVDDNSINQTVGVKMLQRVGYQPDVAANGLEAVQAVERVKYDVVFMDVQMPVLDGFKATEAIVARWPKGARPFIIAMTANSMAGDREKCLAAGMDDYLAKPLQTEVLQSLLEKWGSQLEKDNVSAAPAAPQPAHAPPATASARGSESAPVDMERLDYFTGGSAEGLKDIVNVWFKQTEKQLAQIAAAIERQTAPEIRAIAHSSVGASATCGMNAIVPPLREIEKNAKDGNLVPVPRALADAYAALETIRSFLDLRMTRPQAA